jgi:hypothetical protein
MIGAGPGIIKGIKNPFAEQNVDRNKKLDGDLAVTQLEKDVESLIKKDAAKEIALNDNHIICQKLEEIKVAGHYGNYEGNYKDICKMLMHENAILEKLEIETGYEKALICAVCATRKDETTH